MYIVKPTSAFKKSFKRYTHDHKVQKRFLEVIEILKSGNNLPAQYQDHQLTGNLSLYRECHIYPDVLLIYEIKDKELILLLIRIGSHSDLF